MKHQLNRILACITAFAAVAVLASVSAVAQEKVVKRIEATHQPAMSAADRATVKRFDIRLKQYLKVRDTAQTKIPKLSKDSTPEQIQASETAFVSAMQVARANAKPGDLFAADVAQYIRTTLKREFKPADKKEIRKVVLDDEGGIPVPLKVNYPYPDPKEFVEMPPTLLLKLPALPKQVKYRYVGRNLLLVDTDNNIIVDYMLNALP